LFGLVDSNVSEIAYFFITIIPLQKKEHFFALSTNVVSCKIAGSITPALVFSPWLLQVILSGFITKACITENLYVTPMLQNAGK
jgi:hypothetical protein